MGEVEVDTSVTSDLWGFQVGLKAEMRLKDQIVFLSQKIVDKPTTLDHWEHGAIRLVTMVQFDLLIYCNDSTHVDLL